jgi:putative SOS response-associated peptidase YedK
MCGAYNVINNPFVKSMTEMLKVAEVESRGIRVPASTIQIIRNTDQRELVDAKWWLMLQADGKPNYKYATFNSRYDKLYSSRLTKGLFRQSRCIIPASGIIEGQDKKYHHIKAKDKALALGGIYKTYLINDEEITTASIITCPGNPKLESIHKKSIPLMLNYEDSDFIDAWLDPEMQNSEAFSYLLNNQINHDLIATPTVGARNLEARSEPILINADK